MSCNFIDNSGFNQKILSVIFFANIPCVSRISFVLEGVAMGFFISLSFLKQQIEGGYQQFYQQIYNTCQKHCIQQVFIIRIRLLYFVVLLTSNNSGSANNRRVKTKRSGFRNASSSTRTQYSNENRYSKLHVILKILRFVYSFISRSGSG